MFNFYKYLIVVCLSLIFTYHVYAGPNQNAVISLDLVDHGQGNGQGNQIDDRVTSGTVSGSNEKIVIEVFATGVATELVGTAIIFDFDTSLMRLDRAENRAFSFAIPEMKGINLAHTTSVRLPPSGFLVRAEFVTIADVTNQPFSISIESVTLSETTTSSDIITSSNTIQFNGTTTSNPDTGNIVEPITGDLDLDGDVDFADFLLFSNNFGKTGPVPTSTPTQPTERIVTVTVTVHDTVYISSGGSGSPQEERAQEMLGFWQFQEYTSLKTRYYIIGYINYNRPNDNGELFYWGSTNINTIVGGIYFPNRNQYGLLDQDPVFKNFYFFTLQGDTAVGSLYQYYPYESISDARVYALSPISGRTEGIGFANYMTKPTVPQSTEQHTENRQRNNNGVPQYVIDAHDQVKTFLDNQRK